MEVWQWHQLKAEEILGVQCFMETSSVSASPPLCSAPLLGKSDALKDPRAKLPHFALSQNHPKKRRDRNSQLDRFAVSIRFVFFRMFCLISQSQDFKCFKTSPPPPALRTPAVQPGQHPKSVPTAHEALGQWEDIPLKSHNSVSFSSITSNL